MMQNYKGTDMLNKILMFVSAILFSAGVYAHHMAPDEMQDFITDQLTAVDSIHLLSTEDDPSLLDLIEIPSDMVDVDYLVVAEGDDISDLLDAIENILLVLQTDNEIVDYTVVIEFDMDTGTYTVTLYVDFEE
jgi:hypothetical protein